MKKLRQLWKSFYLSTKGIIFLVDPTDKNRMEEANIELKIVLDDEELKDCAILLFANKQDLDEALLPDEVCEI